MNIIITGACRGIGYETALLFAQEKGNRVITISRTPTINHQVSNIQHICFDLQSDQYELELLPEILKQFNSIDKQR